jgi:hypothetical protein
MVRRALLALQGTLTLSTLYLLGLLLAARSARRRAAPPQSLINI